MQSENRFFDDLAKLVNGAAGGSVRLAQAAPHRMIYDDETDSELEGYA